MTMSQAKLNSLLWDACRDGRIHDVRMCLDRGADVMHIGPQKRSSLEVAIEGGHTSTALCLIERGHDVEFKTHALGSVPLHVAAGVGDLDVAVALMKRGANIEARNGYHSTPLHVAAHHGNTDVVLALIDRGADVMARDKAGETPLDRATFEGQLQSTFALVGLGLKASLEDIDQLLLKPKARGRFAAAALMGDVHACESDSLLRRLAEGRVGFQSRIKDFLECILHRCDLPNLVGEHRASLLWGSCREDSIRVLRALIDRGFDLNQPKNSGGRTFLHLACEQNSDVAFTLIEWGADINAVDLAGCTPLHLMLGSEEFSQAPEHGIRMLTLGADPSAMDARGSTPFRSEKLAIRLIAMGMPSETLLRTENAGLVGMPSLYAAVQAGLPKRTLELLDQGADPYENYNGKSVLSLFDDAEKQSACLAIVRAWTARLGFQAATFDRDGGNLKVIPLRS